MSKKKFRDFKSAREFVRKLGLKNNKEWRIYLKINNIPDDIPKTPEEVYKNEWNSWGDWLGTGNIGNLNKKFLDFESARNIVRRLGLQDKNKWYDYCKSRNKPIEIPSNPNVVYKNEGWKGYGDWLGTGRIAPQNLVFDDFEHAREFVRELGLKGQREWFSYCKSTNKPENIPSAPHLEYKDKGWISYGDWLGTGNIAPKERQFLDFESAREFVRQLGLKSQHEWEKFCQSGKKPIEIPSSPNTTFRKFWKGYGDWLGTGNLDTRTISNQFLSFKEAREEARKLAKQYNIKNWKDWKNAVKKGLIPKNIPSHPSRTYSKKRKKDGKKV